jgi:hypothetical protein
MPGTVIPRKLIQFHLGGSSPGSSSWVSPIASRMVPVMRMRLSRSAPAGLSPPARDGAVRQG